jgi:tRNA(Ile)-lysidine synthase
MSEKERVLAEITEVVEKALKAGAGSRWLLGVSGGRDSVVLLHLLAELRNQYGLELGVLHVNHGLRGKASDLDAAFVQGLAEQYGIACHVESVDVHTLARKRGKGIEDAGRAARRAAVRRWMKREGWTAWVTGHHEDDRREGVILAMLRGAGIRGLGGMREIQQESFGWLLRPILGLSRDAIDALARAEGWNWREDTTNSERIWVRNWVRAELLPALNRTNESSGRHLSGIGESARGLEDAYTVAVADMDKAPRDPEAIRVWVRMKLGHERVWCWSRKAWNLLIREILSGRSGKVRVAGGSVHFGPWGLGMEFLADGKPAVTESWQRQWRVPGSVVLPEAGVHLTAEWGDPGSRPDFTRRELGRLCVEECLCGKSLGLLPGEDKVWTVRSWKQGDRIEPWGMKGRKKIQDLFVDAGVPRSRRMTIPIVTIGERIIWIVGLRFARGLEWHEGCQYPLILRSREVCQGESQVVSFDSP